MSRKTALINICDPQKSLIGLRVAFYDIKFGGVNPSEYYFLGHVSRNPLNVKLSFIENAIEVSSLDGKEYRYFGQGPNQMWHLLVEDLTGELVFGGRSPVLCIDVLST